MAASPPASLQIRKHARKGRALHATRACSPGTTLHVFRAPTLLLPTLAHIATVCSHCLRAGQPRRCTRCRAAYYCDARCQAAAWAAGHKRECAALRAVGRPLPTPVRALLRALLSDHVAGQLAALDGGLDCRETNARAWEDSLVMARAGLAAAGVGREAVEGAELRRAVELLCKIQTNAFHRFDADLGQVGVFLEPTLAMANHSCVPNAMVQFVGREAILRAERPIAAGQEVEISYTDYTWPLSKRREALAAYNFECQCLRCTDDLNVYQVRASPAIKINLGLSLVQPSEARTRCHAIVSDPAKQQLARAVGDSATRSTEKDALPDTLEDRRKVLRAQYRDCRDLVKQGLWAVHPLPQLLTEVSILHAEEGNFVLALAVASLVATRCDPYRYLASFHPVRTKNMFMMAKLLANTAQESVAGADSMAAAATARMPTQRVQEMLCDVDQVSLCQMLLIVVLRSAPTGGSSDWELALAAKEMLQDIAQLPGRQQETSLIEDWAQDPVTERSREFFDYAVVKQVEELAALGAEVLQLDLGHDAAAPESPGSG